jgi:hypothetical protein
MWMWTHDDKRLYEHVSESAIYLVLPGNRHKHKMAKASTSSQGKYTFAELRSEVKDEIKKTGKGGRPGYRRARKRMPIKMRRSDISKVAYIRMRNLKSVVGPPKRMTSRNHQRSKLIQHRETPCQRGKPPQSHRPNRP